MNVQTLRKAFASVSATALLLTTLIVPGMGVNVAQAATDSSHWANDGFETLWDLGAVDEEVGTMLDDGISRGDFVRIILVLAGLADGSESMTELGEIAVEEGILTGDAGNTSALNLDRTLNRAEAVAIVNRTWLDLNDYPSTGDLSGIASGEWYEQNARRAVAGAVIVGKVVNGVRTFAAADTLTYGEAIAVAFQANRAVEALIAWQIAGNDGVPSTSDIAGYDAVAVYNLEVEITFDDQGDAGQVVSGNLVVEKLSDTSKDIVADGSIVSFMTLRFSNQTSQNIVVSTLDIRLKGIANDNQIDGAFLLPFTSDKRSSFAENVSTVFANLTVPAGSSVTTEVALSVKATFQSGTLGLDVIAVDTNASNVLGLPVSGKLVQVVDGANSLGAATVTALNEGARTQRAGTEFRGGKFQITAGSNEIIVLRSILFDEVGSLDADDLAKVRLVNDQTGAELTVCTFVEGDILCDFSGTGILLTEGSNTQVVLMVTVAATADSGSKTFQAQIKRDFHVVIEGQTSDVYILPTVAGAPIGADVITMESGTLVLSKDGTSQTGSVQPGSTNARMGTFKLEAFSETILVTDLEVDLSAGTSAAADFTGTVRVFMHDEGQDPLAGQSLVSIDANDADLFDGTPVFTSANNIRLAPGTKKLLTIVASVATTATNAATTTAVLDIRYERDVSGTVFTTGNVTANQLVMQASTVQVAGNSAFTTNTEVAGSSSVKIGSITVRADSSEKIRVNTVTMNLSSITGLTNLRLVRADKEGQPQFGTTRGTVALTGNSFSSSTPEVAEIDVGATATFDVYVDTQTNAASVFVTLPINAVTFTGAVSSNTRSLPTVAANLPLITIVAGEVLRVTTITQPTKGAVHAGQTGVLLAKVKMEARFGAVTTEEFRFTVANGAGNFQNFTLKKADGTVLLAGVSLINGVVSFPVSMTVQKNLESSLEIYADATPSGQMVSQQNVSLALSGVEYDGAGSGTSGVPVTSSAELLTALASTSSELALAANQTLLVSDLGAGTEDSVALATAAFDYDRDFTALASAPTLNGAATVVAANTRVSTFPYAADDTTKQLTVPAVSTGSANEDFTLGELVFVYQAGVAANTGYGVVTAAATDRVVGTTLNVWLQGDTASTAIVLAAGDVVLHIATPVAYTAAPTPATLAIAVTAGQVAFFGDADTAANSGLTVITDTVAAAADGSAAGAVINGVTLAGGDTLAVFASQQSEIPSAAATFSYTPGTVIVVADSATPANSGVHLVNNTLLPGQSLLTAGALITAKTLVGTATGDRIAVLNGTPIAGEPKQVQDSYPELSTVNTGFGSLITQSEQLVAKLKILNKGPREMLISSFKYRCTGSWSSETGVNDNTLRVERNGSTTLATTSSVANCQSTPVVTLSSPESVAPNGGTLELWLYYDTTTTNGTPATNQFFQIEFDQTSGQVGSCVVTYFYTQASGGTGTNPTAVAPAQICNGSKLFGPSFES